MTHIHMMPIYSFRYISQRRRFVYKVNCHLSGVRPDLRWQTLVFENCPHRLGYLPSMSTLSTETNNPAADNVSNSASISAVSNSR